MEEIYHFLAVFLFSSCTGFSISRSITMLCENDAQVLQSDNIFYIMSYFVVYAATGWGEVPSVWNDQPDETVMLTEFEKKSF